MRERPRYLKQIVTALARNPACAILGPRQCGKTTLAQQIASSRKVVHYFDLERASSQAQLANPETVLGALSGLVVIDEIQRQPSLFAALRPLLDRPRPAAKFLLLGSASPDIVRGVSETLAGRLGFVDISGFDISEIPPGDWRKLWLRGGFPRSLLARNNNASYEWRLDFVRTFLERDIPQLGTRVSSETLRRFWMMIAHYHAQIWNGAEIGRSLAANEHSVRSYLDLLSGAFVVRQLPPWFENISKRQFKAPKVYVRDSGILHALLGLETFDQLSGHPKLGASWEGFALEQILSLTGARDAYFWGTHSGAELDLLLLRRGKRFGVEFKCTDAPSMTKSLHIALQDLTLEHVWVVYPGNDMYPMHKRVTATPIAAVQTQLAKLL